MELSVTGGGFVAEPLESREEFVSICESGLCEGWKAAREELCGLCRPAVLSL